MSYAEFAGSGARLAKRDCESSVSPSWRLAERVGALLWGTRGLWRVQEIEAETDMGTALVGESALKAGRAELSAF